MSDQAPKRLDAPFQYGFKMHCLKRFKLTPSRLWILLPLVALAACAQRGGPIPYDVKNFGAPDQPVILDASLDYRIAPQDVVTISVFGVNEFSGDYVIDPLGRLRMPLVGDIPAQGLTVDQLSTQVTQKLGSSYLRDPKVQVVVKEAKGRKITVEGSVAQPGIYPIAGETTLLQALAMARGTTDDANPSRVVIFRTINGQRMAAAFDVKDIRRGRMPDPAVFQNDVVVVDGSRSRQIFRDVVSSLPALGLFTRF